MAAKIVDTHVHIWDFDKAEYSWLKGNTSILNQTYTIEALENDRQRVGITEGILVQAANNLEELEWMLEVAEQTSWLKGVVGWLPITDAREIEAALDLRYGKNPYLKGVRHLIHDEPDTQWLLQQNVVEALSVVAQHGLAYDVVGVKPEHIDTALQLVQRLPQLRMVFDHMNQPPIAAGEKFGRWGDLMKEAAEYPQFFVKISGLGTSSKKGDSWTAEDIKPYVAFVLEHFGEDRCMLGGDWPVSLLAGSYLRTWDIYKQLMNSLLNASQREKVYYKNAERFYGI